MPNAADAAQPPNLLFVFPDQHRFDWLGSNPALSLRTPHLDALQQRGMTFTRCYTPSPVCSPARACLASGRHYPHCGVRSNSDCTPYTKPTYYQHLRDAGYEVAGVGKFDLHKPDQDWGLDGQNLLPEYGFTAGADSEGKGDAIASYRRAGTPRGPYMQYLQQRGLAEQHLAMYDNPPGILGPLNFSAITSLPEDAYCDNWIGQNGEELLRGFAADRPWHLVLNFTGPHDPYDVTPAMHDAWQTTEFPAPIACDEVTDGIRERQQHYAAMIENIDRWLGRLVDVVAERGELERTLIVFCSDHGEMLGDHGRWQKSVYHEASTHVPLVIAGPGVAAGARTDTLVAMHDLAPTFLDVAGAKPFPQAEARSLRPTLSDPDCAHRQRLHSGLGDWEMLVQDRWKLVLQDDQPPLLFDLHADPGELVNRAEEQPEVVKKLRQALAEEVAAALPL